jgi:hypothetical protein
VAKRAEVAHAGPTAVEAFCAIGELELENAQLWFSSPKAWKLRLAWSVNLLTLIGLGLTILLISLTNPIFGELGRWVDGVVLASVESQALKLFVAEPFIFVAVPLFEMLVKRCVPEVIREEITDILIAPVTDRLARFAAALGM